MNRLLYFSLFANVVLLVLAWHLRTPQVEMTRELRAVASNTVFSPTRPAQRDDRNPSLPEATLIWDRIETSDPAELIARLRAAGCPETTIRDIVTFRVCREFRNRLLSAVAQQQWAMDYTKRSSWNESHKYLSSYGQDLRNEMIYTLESLLGEPWQTLSASLTGWPGTPDNWQATLSIDQRRDLRALETRYRELRMDFQMSSITGTLDAEDVARLTESDREQQARLAEILSPQQLSDYLYRKSEAAEYVHRNLPPAQSESEFRAMVDVALELGMSNVRDRAPSIGMETAEDPEWTIARDQRKTALDEQLKQALGDQRFDEQRREQDSLVEAETQRASAEAEQRERAEFIARAESLGVSAEDAGLFMNRLEELQPALEAKFTELEQALTGTPEEKQQMMMAAVRAELEQIAVETVGEQGIELIGQMLEQQE